MSFLNAAFSSPHWNDHNPYFTSPNSKSSFVIIGDFRDTGNHHVIIYSLANAIKLHIKNTSDLKYFKVLIKTLFTWKKILIEKCVSNKDWILVLGIVSDCLEPVFKKV